ncbi:MAG: M36 family metallopeptidase [Anaerolineae bacterium]|nr:M36 family metallopeptidase [Anaerolineae bacterium]
MNTIKKSGFVLAVLCMAVLAITSIVMARESERTEPTGNADALAIALAHLDQNKATLGLTAADLAEARVSDTTVSRLSGVTTIYLAQQLGGIEVFNGLINISIMPNGDVLTVGNRFVPDLAAAVSEGAATIAAEQAVNAAADHLDLTLRAPLQIIRQADGSAQETLFSDGGISQDPIPAKLVYDASGKTPRLAWNVIIYQLDSLHWWNVRVDANTGEILSKNDWVVNENFDAHVGGAHDGDAHFTGVVASAAPANSSQPVPFGPTPAADGSSYRVYHMPVESPIHTAPLPPADGRTLENTPADAGGGSPFGWHDTNGAVGEEFTTTQGNNAHAYTDTNADNVPDPGSSPDGGAGLDFDFPLDLTQPPSAYRPAAVTNLFHWNNLVHDVNYRYGFDEVHGNFQENNYGNGGLGSDYVQAEAQDGSGTNNANFATPPDGSNPRMQMYVWTAPTPDLDGDLDNGIIAHEYGHGISNRMVGGPSNVSCLGNQEQMGEGWSDWQSVIMTMRNGHTATTNRGVGTYALNQPPNGPGIRPAPYTTDMTVNTYTYGNLPSMAVPHGVGFVWNTMLWEMNWGLIAEHGFNEDLYLPNTPVSTWSGNQLAHALVTEAFNLTPCSPGFVDGRNAILAADVALTGGQNACTIWAAFAKRGLGFSADQGSSGSRSDGTEAFDMPQSCLTLGVNPTSHDICQGDTAVYTVDIGTAFTPPVDMSATGHPAPATATFTPDPVPSVPSTTDLTIANTGSVAAGSYVITILGDDGVITDSVDVDLNVFAGVPGAAPTLTTPPNGATDIDLSPTLEWTAVSSSSSYQVQIADDAGFSNIVYDATVAGTSHVAAISLDPVTTYYWRVRASNPCGDGAYSSAFSFTTRAIPPILLVDDDDNGPDVRAYYTDALDNLGAQYDIWDTANTDNEPSAIDLTPYELVIWFTGDEFGGFAGPGSAGESALSSWLDAGGCFFISSQDYRYDKGLTSFMTGYLGVSNVTDDNGNYTSVTGQNVFGGLGPYTLTFPYSDFTDPITPGNGGIQAMLGDNSNVGGVTNETAVYKTSFWAFGLETLPVAGQEASLQALFDWCTLTPTNPTIVVEPDSLAATQAPDVQTTQTLTISNTGTANLDWTIDEDAGFSSMSGGGWSDNFDSYPTGQDLHGVGGWKGWDNNPAFTAFTTATQARSAPNSVDIVGNADLVQEYTGATSGQWTYTAWQYVPSSMTGLTYFIMLNTYADGGPNNWSVQVNFNAATDTVTNDGATGGTLPLVEDQWVEIRLEIDLDADTQSFYYNNQLLYSGTWTGEVSGGGALNIGAVDLFANAASSVYYDDMSLAGPPAAPCDVPSDISWLDVSPTAGTTVPGGAAAVDVTFDSTGLSAGTYTGTLCVESNDLSTPLVQVPITLEVEATSVYGVEVIAEADALSGAPGSTVTYTVWITNTGNVADTFDLTVAGNIWNTALSDSFVTLNAGQSASVSVWVDIPGGAGDGDTDMVTVTATSQGDPSANDSVALTTTAVIGAVYGVSLSPDDAATGASGSTVNYTVWITNTGDVTDTYDLAITGNIWDSTPSVSSVSLNPGESTSVSVAVDIPANAGDGDMDTATVTATSTGDGTVSDSTDLTTTAVTSPEYGVEVAAEDVDLSGDAGTTVTYTVWVTNTGNVQDTFAVTVSGNGWDTIPSVTSITLGAGVSGSVMVLVDIPAGAANDDTDTATVTVTSQTDAAAEASVTLTTTAVVPPTSGYTIYLPVILKP